MKISRHYSSHHYQNNQHIFEAKLALYEDRIRGWFHDQARILEKVSDHAGFILLLVAIGYIESYAIFWKGEDSRNQSKEFFREAFKDIFPLNTEIEDDQHQAYIDRAAIRDELHNNAIDEVYEQVRCGLFHIGITRHKVVISNNDEAVNINTRIDIETGAHEVIAIRLNPHKMLNRIEDHFSNYLMELRNPEEEELRDNFNTSWERIFGEPDLD